MAGKLSRRIPAAVFLYLQLSFVASRNAARRQGPFRRTRIHASLTAALPGQNAPQRTLPVSHMHSGRMKVDSERSDAGGAFGFGADNAYF